MNWKQIVLSLVLLDFMALCVWALWSHGGMLPMLEELASTPAGLNVMADFLIFYVAGMVWMVRDARERGLSPWPWVVTTAATGSIGLLAYLIKRAASPAPVLKSA